MADFSTEVELSLSVPTRELRSAKSQIESGLGDVSVGVSSDGPASRATDSGRSNRRERRMFRWARQRTDDISEILDVLLDVEEKMGEGGGGDGGGNLLRRLPRMGSLALLGGGLAVGASMLISKAATILPTNVIGSVADMTADAVIGAKAAISQSDVIQAATTITAKDVIETAATVPASVLVGTAATISASALIAQKATITASDVITGKATVSASDVIATAAAISAASLVATKAVITPSDVIKEPTEIPSQSDGGGGINIFEALGIGGASALLGKTISDLTKGGSIFGRGATGSGGIGFPAPTLLPGIKEMLANQVDEWTRGGSGATGLPMAAITPVGPDLYQQTSNGNPDGGQTTVNNQPTYDVTVDQGDIDTVISNLRRDFEDDMQQLRSEIERATGRRR